RPPPSPPRPMQRGESVPPRGANTRAPKPPRRPRLLIAISYPQVEDDFFVGARRASEIRRNKLFINHSCEPNLGIRGQLTFVARRPIKAGEELTYDWAMEENSPAATRCACGARRCRRRLTGRAWAIRALQHRYRGSFAAYLEEKIAARKRRLLGGGLRPPSEPPPRIRLRGQSPR